MCQIYVREINAEVLICLEKNMPDRLSALEEAVKVLAREVVYERAHSSRSVPRGIDSDLV